MMKSATQVQQIFKYDIQNKLEISTVGFKLPSRSIEILLKLD